MEARSGAPPPPPPGIKGAFTPRDAGKKQSSQLGAEREYSSFLRLNNLNDDFPQRYWAVYLSGSMAGGELVSSRMSEVSSRLLDKRTKKSSERQAAFRLLDRRSSAGIGKRGKRESPEKTRRPAALSGTIPRCVSLVVTPPGIEPGSPRRELRLLCTRRRDILEVELQQDYRKVWIDRGWTIPRCSLAVRCRLRSPCMPRLYLAGTRQRLSSNPCRFLARSASKLQYLRYRISTAASSSPRKKKRKEEEGHLHPAGPNTGEARLGVARYSPVGHNLRIVTAGNERCRGGVVLRLLASHQGERGSIPGGLATGFWLVGNRAGRYLLFGGFSRESPVSPRPSISGVASYSHRFTLVGWFTPLSTPLKKIRSFQDKVAVKHVYTGFTFSVGSQFIRHALDDSKLIADYQGKQLVGAILATVWVNEQACGSRVYTGLRSLASSRVVSLAATPKPTSPKCLNCLKETGNSAAELMSLAQEFSEACQTFSRPVTDVRQTQ
ncbi:hypothetical protein PR048_031533 [Dryococelus australis]|uniref:Uncharacterized protein n=1 Tax=Dryococelus australis TaxID=614101 RepID=A0ABQ9G5K1_9NEOP|nr:hypothetical protein PR048_031533 [Dryococelus australis]